MAADIKVLIVDDNENECRTLKNILDKAGFKASTAGGSAQALAMVQETDFNIIFMDLVLKGDQSGVEIFRQIKKLRPEAKVILFTGYGPEEETGLLKEAIMAGMTDEFLRKPVWPEEMLKAIEKHSGGNKNG